MTSSTLKRAAGGKPGTWRADVSQALGRALVGLGNRLMRTPAEPHSAAEAGVSGGQPATGSGDRFASLASMIPGVVYQRIVNPDGEIRYTYLSEGARQMFGVSPEEVMESPEALFKTYSEDYKSQFRQRLLAASQSLTKWDVEASIVAPDGSIRYTHAIANPERLEDGSVLWTGLILDATRIKQAEDELKAANRSVEAANRAKSMFLANMSHEIRTPMNGVLGMAEVLLKTELTPRQLRLLGTLKNSARTLLGIINDVLDISRIEAGRFNLESEEFDLHGCLEDVIELCAGAAYQKGLELNLIVESELPAIVKGDAGRLRQVLINLIGNAVKFTEKGEAILRVSSSQEAEGRARVVFSVIDTGIGIGQAAKEKLFAPFSQADTSISRRFGGTGLGLAITRHLVTLMGGTVGLESTVGVGTKVTFDLPLQVVSSKLDDSAHAIDGLAGKRVLIVDDRQSSREALAAHLLGKGTRLELASSADHAIHLLDDAVDAGDPFAAVIVDRVRPNFDSLDFCRTIRSDQRLDGTAIVHVVSSNWKAISDQSQALTGTTLAKPVRRSELLATLERCLSGAASGASATPSSGDERTIQPAPSMKFDLRVLLVEDNPVNQEVAREYLAAFGCEVSVAENGYEAIAAVGAEAFDIVLMDCQMPVLDGLSATRRIREREQQSGDARLPIIAVTANAYESDRQEALEAGMDGYLTKPFSDTELAEVLSRWSKTRQHPVAA